MSGGVLVTADGEVFRGRSVGAPGVAVGEGVFNTSMTGYQEVLTDPSYAGQVVAMTTSHIGNYGVTARDDQAGRVHATGLVMRSLARRHSNWRAEGSLSDRLTDQGVVALDGIDTRRLTRHLRDRGAMPVAIGSDVDAAELVATAAAAPSMTGQDLASTVSTREPYVVAAVGERLYRVAVLDLGVKRGILERLAARGVETTVMPIDSSVASIEAAAPDGIFLSNGPGDPEPLEGVTVTVRALLGSHPIFGICLGHQVLARALGASTFKLPFGHHGGNHPVRRLCDGRVEVTAQNHGFAVDLWSLVDGEDGPADGSSTSLPGPVETAYGTVIPTHQNLNDGTLEGLECADAAAFSVQYHPEAFPGPHDADHLFDRFVAAMGGPAHATA
jgi:carbamoyl-phosphate synthase small subunit